MERRLLNSLHKLNLRFYDTHAESFSNSRQSIWPGWLRVSDHLENLGLNHIDLLDIAAGNGRFEAFMAERFPEVVWNAVCVDPCEDLMSMAQGKLAAIGFGNMTCASLPFDVLEFLIENASDRAVHMQNSDSKPDQLIVPEQFDLVTCFGFMHHVYGQQLRKSLMNLLLNQTRSGGIIVASFWRFASDEQFAQKAEDQTQRALQSAVTNNLMGPSALEYRERGDYLLGWQGNTDIPRYCHSFDEDEVTELIDSLNGKAYVLDRFFADGRTGTMNEYVILRVE